MTRTLVHNSFNLRPAFRILAFDDGNWALRKGLETTFDDIKFSAIYVHDD